ncbi:hypothetical protein SAMN02745165_03316 [Malonomonas rubra DSM 5091]|uniref:Uncharacterized protein n=1 Tax=Malonomonas rubra DSM 5091 TaxID=1122189 RepID=A0A1M6MKZ6_MALRU|nr:hypothetical protein [Malonomonas rubra]SHJ84094.1 hypothetical protein SAMN02745165_03316 [Malonomonas rubra DSM 5091]
MKKNGLSAFIALLFLFPTLASADIPAADHSIPELETALFALG